MKKILSISLLMIFLMGQVNLTMASHFCGEELVSTNVGVNVQKDHCCGDKEKAPKDCCEDQIAQADADDFFGKTKIDLKVSPSFLLAYTIVLSSGIEKDIQKSAFSLENESVPIPDYQILFQTFLI
ncbi:HYC_CC_PP family protein [Algoriphagus sediminis]|uniref:Secreted protein n=1 Tax=Algoriphagus sediminis TaxID=3057113 RepID=A0ABT7YHU6_9BACT|nr:hypothetical protein [Algoriphagus sediminis]MDN3205905.1 hypothetical protein [Algoriphagus sediminis]